MSINNCWLAGSVKVMNITLIPKNIFHYLSLQNLFTSIDWNMLNDSNCLNIQYFFTRIETFVELLSNCVDDIIAQVSLDCCVSIQLFHIYSFKLWFVIMILYNLNIFLIFIKAIIAKLLIYVEQIINMVFMTILVRVVRLNVFVSFD